MFFFVSAINLYELVVMYPPASSSLFLLTLHLFSVHALNQEEISLQNAYFSTFKVYQKAIALAHQRELTPEQSEEMQRILDEQPNVVYDTLREIVGYDGQVKHDPTKGYIGFVFMNGPLNKTQQQSVDEALIKHHLHFTKQIILLLDLTPEDLGLDYETPFTKKVNYYLFGNVGQESGKASDYINSVNIIYALIRTRLSEMAHKGELSAKQTISAKKIIHVLNKETVEAMVLLLKLNDTTMSPDDLVSLIKTKRTDGSLDDLTELKIKEVVYFKKLLAIKNLVLLLHMERKDIDVPENAPEDLTNVIFSPGIKIFEADDKEEIKAKSYDANYTNGSSNFFCMPCFHEAYTQWKCENNIEPC